MRRSSPQKVKLLVPLVAVVVVLDQITKATAVDSLLIRGVPRSVFGEWFRWTLVYNPGAAFGLHLGPYSRWIFLTLTLGALYILAGLYRQTRAGDWLRTIAIGLVSGGAVGNLIDRIRSPLGVVDFIDIGLQNARWPTFNVADMAVSTGAILLAWVLWGEDKAQASEAASVVAAAEPRPVRDA